MFEPNELIDTVINVLQQYDYEFTRKSETELKVHRKGEHGFDIVLETSYRENTLYFEGFHWHFGNLDWEIEEMLDLLLAGLTGAAKIKVFSKKGTACKWELEIEDNDGQWKSHGTVSLMRMDFWNEAKITYLQNL